MEQCVPIETFRLARQRRSARLARVPSTSEPELSRKRKREVESPASPDHRIQPDLDLLSNQLNPQNIKHSAHTKKHAQRKPALTFLSLPQELRLMIYTHVFSSGRLVILEDHPWDGLRPPTLLQHSFGLELLLTCRAIYLEARHLIDIAPLTLTLDRLLTLARRRREDYFFGRWALLFERPPGHRWVGKLQDGTFASSHPAVPDNVFMRVSRLELPYPERCPVATSWGSGLSTVGLMDQVCHFQEVDRPSGEDGVREVIVASCHHHLPRLLLGQGKWPSAKFPRDELVYEPDGEPLPYEIDPVATVWFMNTQRKSGEGWTLRIDSRTEEVSNVRRAWFERVPFDLRILKGKVSPTKDQMAALHRAWKLSVKGWKMTRLL